MKRQKAGESENKGLRAGNRLGLGERLANWEPEELESKDLENPEVEGPWGPIGPLQFLKPSCLRSSPFSEDGAHEAVPSSIQLLC